MIYENMVIIRFNPNPLLVDSVTSYLPDVKNVSPPSSLHAQAKSTIYVDGLKVKLQGSKLIPIQYSFLHLL